MSGRWTYLYRRLTSMARSSTCCCLSGVTWPRPELLDRTLVWNQVHLRRILRAYEIHHNQHRPHRSLAAAAPLKPLAEPVDLDRYRVRWQTHTACLINEYRLVALRGRGFSHAQRLQSSGPRPYPRRVPQAPGWTPQTSGPEVVEVSCLIIPTPSAQAKPGRPARAGRRRKMPRSSCH